MIIEFLKETDSTNEYIKQYLPSGKNCIVCATRQTHGKGTKGRSFFSQEGGIYLSALTFYENFPACNAFRIMTQAAVAVCRTVAEFTPIPPEIKWPNDILLEGKKVCGILIENILKGDVLHASIIGIGLNVRNDLSAIRDIAVSLSEFDPDVELETVREKLIKNFQKGSGMDEYLSYIRFLGKDVVVTEGEQRYMARACAILPDGRLEIAMNHVKRALSSGEISIKL